MSTAHCTGHYTPGTGVTPCPWTAEGTPDEVDKAAEKAVKRGCAPTTRAVGA